MRRWLAPPQFTNEYETFAARVLHYTLLLLLGVVFVFLLFVSSSAQLIYIPVFVGTVGGCYYLLHRRRLRLAGLIFVSVVWTIITLAAFSINGIRNSSLSGYAIVIIFSAVLFSNRAVIVFTGLSVLVSIILVVGETLGVLPLRTTPLFLADRFFQLIALFGASGVLLTATSRVIRASLQRTREQQQLLLERNRELELEIAERRRVEADLRISEAKYRLLFENIPVMAAVYGPDGEIILLNNAAAATLGGTPASLQGRNMRDVFSAEDAERGIQNQAEVLQTNTPKFVERMITLPNGRELYFLRHIMPLPNSDAAQVLTLTTDLTERYLAEQRERELALANEKNAFLADFFSTLSHDLKTPLTVMTTSLYLLERAVTPDQRHERMARMGEQITLMNKYIQDMLTIARLEHLPTQDFQALDLNPLVTEVSDLLRPRIEDKQLVYQFDEQSDLPAVRGNPEQLQRMLTNLVENAVNYTPAGGQVTVKTFALEGRVGFEVQDSGMGIEPEAVSRIFERFFRTPRAKDSVGSGTGLGLAIVKKIVETHQATIDVRSQVGAGTTFLVQFPTELTI